MDNNNKDTVNGDAFKAMVGAMIIIFVMSVFAFGMIHFTDKFIVGAPESMSNEQVDKCAAVCYPYFVHQADPCTCDARYFRMEPNE